MNSVILIGRLTKDPELRFIAGSGKAVANFDLAVERDFSKDKEADFFKIVVWGKTAEAVANYTAKGKLIAVKGSLQNDKWKDKEGNNRITTKVIADRVQFLEWAKSKDTDTNFSNNHTNDSFDNGGFGDFQTVDDDDVPFV